MSGTIANLVPSQIVPLQPVPSQTLTTTLGGQSCTINVYTKGIETPHLYLDLSVSGVLVLSGVICRNATAIVRNTYFGFVGDLAFYDTQGSTDPAYSALGSRYVLAYLATPST